MNTEKLVKKEISKESLEKLQRYFSLRKSIQTKKEGNESIRQHFISQFARQGTKVAVEVNGKAIFTLNHVTSHGIDSEKVKENEPKFWKECEAVTVYPLISELKG
ncbi:MAG: hypothetical protein LUC47_09800 [Clostridiales bacterium]|nr:hypothetical protein [Clostridiales bacterium]